MSSVLINSFTIPISYNYEGSSGTIRWFYSEDFLDSNNQFVKGGDGQSGFYFESTFVITGGLLVAAAQSVISTTDSRKPYVTLSCQIFDENGTPRDVIFTGWTIPTTTPTSIGVLEILNEAKTLGYPFTDVYLTRTQIIALILAELAALGAYFGAGVATLVDGSVVVPLSSVVSGSKFQLTPQGHPSGIPYVSAISVGVSFTIASTDIGDNVDVLWTMYEP